MDNRSRIASAVGAELPMLHQKVFAPYKVAILVDAAADRGIMPDAALDGTGLDPAQIRDPHALTSIADYLRAYENIIAHGADLSVAFEVGSRIHLSAYGMYGYALMCAPTVRDFCDFAVRYHALATPIQDLGWRHEGDLVIWDFPEIYHEVITPRARDFIVRQQMMMTATHIRDVAGPDLRPIRALFGLPDAGTGTTDRDALGCHCAFDMPAHELHYPATLLDTVPQFANRMTYAWIKENCDGLLNQAMTTAGLSGEIYQLLMRAPDLSITMDAIAQRLGMTERTLRRRLEREDTRFADIVDDVRKRLTLQYVQTSRMSADDIATRAGFSDTTNLRRAVKRWTGRTIGELRT
jgi:AraC-like DNA-binding protein